MDVVEVPDVIVRRLPSYVRVLTQLLAEGAEVVSSQQLASRLLMTSALIRKDLNSLGRFGKRGTGFEVGSLLEELRQVLGLDRKWRACLVGVGRLGRAIINYPGFGPEGFEIVAAFDKDARRVGRLVGGLKVQPMSELGQTVEDRGVAIGIVAVPASQVQGVVDELVRSGVRGILNYAPVAPHVPEGAVMRNMDPVLSLQSMTFYLKGEEAESG